MNLVITEIIDLNTDKERIELKAMGDDNTVNYILIDAVKNMGVVIDNKCRNAFWFPNQRFKKGDIIRVFTKPGRASSIAINKTQMRYTFYWGMKDSVWQENADNAKLLRIIESGSRIPNS